jgi:multidrug efflux pump subunit AcrB
VNNRVQVALAKMPDEVRRSGVRVQKKSSALLAVIALSSPKKTRDELFLSNYVTINLSIKSRARRVSATRPCSGRRITPCAYGSRPIS